MHDQIPDINPSPLTRARDKNLVFSRLQHKNGTNKAKMKNIAGKRLRRYNAGMPLRHDYSLEVNFRKWEEGCPENRKNEKLNKHPKVQPKG